MNKLVGKTNFMHCNLQKIKNCEDHNHMQLNVKFYVDFLIKDQELF